MKTAKKIIIILLVCILLEGAALYIWGRGVSQEKLMEQGIDTELYSPELLAEKIENAVFSGDHSFQVKYYGSIEDIEDLANKSWAIGYVNNRYVDHVEVNYEEFKGYVAADYTIYTTGEDILAGLLRDDGSLEVYSADFAGIDQCVTDMMERRADPARYLIQSSLSADEIYNELNDILYDYQNQSYVYPYTVSNLSWTMTSYDDITELELDPEYREDAKPVNELPRVSSVTEYIEMVSDMWGENYGGNVDVLMENLPITEEEIFGALMIAEANTALMPCEANEVSYLRYSGYDGKYVLSARLYVPYGEQELAPMQDELIKAVEDIAKEIMAEEEGAKDRYKAAYKAVMSAAEYSDSIAEATEEDAVTDNMRILRSAYGALIEGETVCTGYAKAYKAICDRMGLECIMVNGKQDDVGHAWNMVMLDGAPYYVDCTYGDTGGGSDYCLFTQEELEEWDYEIDKEYSVYGLA